MNEILGIQEWVHAALTGDGTITQAVGGRIYQDAAPQMSAEPFIVHEVVSAEDLNLLGGGRAATEVIVRVVLVARNQSLNPYRGVIHHMDNVLHGKRGTAIGGTVGNEIDPVIILQSMRSEPIQEVVLMEGLTYQIVGGTYRILAQGQPGTI